MSSFIQEKVQPRERGALNKTAPFERNPYSHSGDIEFLGDPTITEALLSKGYGFLDAPTKLRVTQGMLRAIENHEIFDSVVPTIPIYMMNDLGGGKIASDVFRHDKSVFLDNLSIKKDTPIAFGVINYIAQRLASPTTKTPIPMSGLGMISATKERLPAMEASNAGEIHARKSTTELTYGSRIGGQKLYKEK